MHAVHKTTITKKSSDQQKQHSQKHKMIGNNVNEHYDGKKGCIIMDRREGMEKESVSTVITEHACIKSLGKIKRTTTNNLHA